MSKPLPKISAALAKPTAAAPISWLAFVVLGKSSRSSSHLLYVVPWMGVSCYWLRAQHVAQGQPTFLSL